MLRNIQSFLLVLVLMLTSWLPAAQPLLAATDAIPSSTVQGEIAYVLEGNLWLLDLITGESQQLTTDGDNRWPSWSADGRYLLYTHATSEDDMALYRLEVDSKAKPQLVAADTCCAAWGKVEEQVGIFYISTAESEPRLKWVLADGTGEQDLLPALQVGRSSWPAGNLRWNGNELLLPLEVIDNTSGSGLIDYTGIFVAHLSDGTLQPLASYGQSATCSIGHPDFYRNPSDVPILAGDFVGDLQCGGQDAVNQGVWIDEVDKLRQLPQLAYPSFSNDHLYLAAERYAAGDDATTAAPEGIVLYNLNDDSQQLLVEQAAQPAWRPAPPIPAAVARYLQAGERVVSLAPTLTWQGATWQIHLLTTSKLPAMTPQRLLNASSESLQQQGVTAVIVTRGETVVRDPAQLGQFFLLYSAAHTLYTNPPADLLPPIGDELNKVLNNPIFMAMAAPQLLRSRRSQTAEALRTLLTDATEAQSTLDPLFEQAFATTPTTVAKALDALGATIENSAAYNDILLRLRPDLAAAYNGMSETAQGEKINLQLLQLTAQLLFLNQLQAERGQWLQRYLDTFAEGEGSFDRDQLRAAVAVLDEVQSNNQQRIDLAINFAEEMGKSLLLDKVGEAARAGASQLAAHLAEKFGTQLADNSVAGLLAAGMVGMSVGNLLYGTDELYANFSLAARADELRATFAQGRQALQRQAAATTSYDGDLAERFRIAYLLETLAAIQSQRSYADGVAATFQLPNPIPLINWLRSEDWQAAVKELHEMADTLEANLLTEFATPSNVAPLLALVAARVNTQTSAPACKETTSKAHPEWTSYTNSNYVTDMLVLDDTLWAATTGGVACWDTVTGSYHKYTVEDGLANNYVARLIQSADGALWFGTEGGVSRLSVDGVWTTFTTADGLAGNAVLNLLQSTDGALWFSTFKDFYDFTGGAVSRLGIDGRWTTFTTADGLVDNDVFSMLQSTDGALWFSTFEGLSRLSPDGTWTTFTRTDGLADNHVNHMLQSTDSAFWFSTFEGLSRLNPDGTWTTFTTADGLVDNHVLSMLQSTDGALWFSTFEGLSRLNPDGIWTTFTTADGLASDSVTIMLQSADGALWFGTQGGGVSRLSADGEWTTFTTADGLVDMNVNHMLQSTDGAFWFSTFEGLSRLNPDGTWTTFTTADGLVDNHVLSMLQSTDGALWFSTFEGLSRLNPDGIWTTFTTADGLASDSVTIMLQSADGALWFGSAFNGVSRLGADGGWTTFTTADGLVNMNAHPMLQSTDGALWFSTSEGLSRLNPDGTWTTFTTGDGLADMNAYLMLQSTDGTLWFGAYGSISRLSIDGELTTFTTADGLVDNAVTSLLQSMDGTLWVGTLGGVSRLSTDGEWTTFTTADGLADNHVSSLLQSADGALWFGTRSGVSRYQPEEK